MSTEHLDTLRIIHESTFIAAIDTRECPAYEMKNSDKTGGNGLVFST